MAKRCVLEQNLLLTAYRKSYGRTVYEKSIGTKMKDFDILLRGRIKVMSTNRKWPYGESNGYVTDDVT